MSYGIFAAADGVSSPSGCRATHDLRNAVMRKSFVPGVSIIIPVVGDLDGLEDTLVSVLENRPAHSQIVVALGCPYDDPYDLEGEVDFVRPPDQAGLATVLNTAVAVSEAPVVHVLRCGVQATAGWADAALPLFAEPDVAAVAPLVVQQDAPQRIVAAGLACRANGSVRRVAAGKTLEAVLSKQPQPHGPDALAAFYRKSALDAVGGFDVTVGDDLIAADTTLALRAAGLRCVLASRCHLVADRTVASSVGALRRGFQAERFFWRWAAIHGRVRAILYHALSLAADTAQCPLRPTKAVELMGRSFGLLWSALAGSKRPVPCQMAEDENDSEREEALQPHFARSSEVAA
jgi:hypothetical protein